jgi:ribonucleoside-diphosphate reductase alpha chain
VLKRSGILEDVAFDKIAERMEKLKHFPTELSDTVDVSKIVGAVASSIHDEISTKTIDTLTADIAMSFASIHIDYAWLAARILVSNLHKETQSCVLDVFEKELGSTLSPRFVEVIKKHGHALNDMLCFHLDYKFDYFGIKTLQKLYLAKNGDGTIVERPQHMFLRVAVCLHEDDLEKVRETYEYLSSHRFIHASPTLFNAGMLYSQMSSCYLLGIHEDSLDNIFDTMKVVARISKFGGGIGMHIHSVRGKNAPIKSTNGTSDGILPMLKTYNEIAQYVNQSGRRRGSIAVYMEPHHPDILAFLDLKRPSGDESLRARHLFLGLWISDLFMERVQEGKNWSLFESKYGLQDVWGDEYKLLYETLEREGKATAVIPAQTLWIAIITSQTESGVPYIVYKDAANRLSNQQHLGTIKCSNLCTEIIEFTSPDEVAVCKCCYFTCFLLLLLLFSSSFSFLSLPWSSFLSLFFLAKHELVVLTHQCILCEVGG